MNKKKNKIGDSRLFNSIYDSDKKVLKYEVTPYHTTNIELPNEIFRGSTLVINKSSNNDIAGNR
jgi:hypothetical protein